MKENIAHKRTSSIFRMAVLGMLGHSVSPAGAVEPEKQPIYSNIILDRYVARAAQINAKYRPAAG